MIKYSISIKAAPLKFNLSFHLFVCLFVCLFSRAISLHQFDSNHSHGWKLLYITEFIPYLLLCWWRIRQNISRHANYQLAPTLILCIQCHVNPTFAELFVLVHIMAAEDLATQETRSPGAKVLTWGGKTSNIVALSLIFGHWDGASSRRVVYLM